MVAGSDVDQAGLSPVGYATGDIRYIWKGEEPIKIDNDVKLPQFIVMGHKTHSHLFTTSTGKQERLLTELTSPNVQIAAAIRPQSPPWTGQPPPAADRTAGPAERPQLQPALL